MVSGGVERGRLALRQICCITRNQHVKDATKQYLLVPMVTDVDIETLRSEELATGYPRQGGCRVTLFTSPLYYWNNAIIMDCTVRRTAILPTSPELNPD